MNVAIFMNYFTIHNVCKIKKQIFDKINTGMVRKNTKHRKTFCFVRTDDMQFFIYSFQPNLLKQFVQTPLNYFFVCFKEF